MAEDLIDSYIDRNGVKRDTDYILDAINQVYRAFKDVEGIKIDMRGFEGLSKISPALLQAKAGADALAESTKVVEVRIDSLNGHSKEFTQVLHLQTKAQKEAAQTALLQAKTANELAKAKGELSKASALEAKASAEAAKAKAAELKITEQKSKSDTADLKLREQIRKESEKSATALRKSNEELKNSTKVKEKSAAELVREQKLIEQATNDYLQLSRAYNEASLKAKNYVLRLGEQHPIAVQAVKDANDLGNVLKKLDASVGQNQRNVGNYASAYNGLGMSFTQVARELPSLSISVQQFALAVSNNLPMVADELRKAKDEINALKAAGKDAPSLFSKIGSALFSWQVGLSVGITLLTVYAKQITAFFTGLIKGNDALSDTRRQTELLNTARKEGNKAAGDEIAKLEVLYKVATDNSVATKKRKEAVDELQRQYPEHFKNINDEIILQGKAAAAYSATKQAILDSAQAMAIQGKLSGLATQELDLLQEQVDLTNTLSKAQGVLAKQKLAASGETGPKGAAATYGPETQNLRLIQQEIQGYNDRAAANKKSLEQIAKDREFLLSKIKEAPIEDPEKEGTKKNLQAEADKRIQILAELRSIEIRRDIDFYKAQTENEDLSLVERLQALQKYYQSRKALIDLNADTERQIGKKTSEELLLVEAKRADDLIKLDTETYAERDRLINEFSKKFTEDQKKAYEATDKVIQAAYNRWAKLEEERTKKNREEGKKREKDDEEFAANKKRLQQELVKELLNLAQTLGTASIEREKNAIQEQIDQLEAKKQKDIEVANSTIGTAQDRAAAISAIEARAAAQREQLERRQRELDVKKAQFDKARSIANIIQETAQNIVKYFGTPLALLAGAIGAVQLATVIAQPIPRYKHGKNAGDNYEGPAIVDDGGKPEAIIREDGTVEIGGNTPRLTYVKKRDVVLPDANQLINYVLAGHMGGRLQVAPSQQKNDDLKEVKQGLQDVVAAIKSQPKTDIRANEGGLTAVIKYGASQLKYINDQTNW